MSRSCIDDNDDRKKYGRISKCKKICVEFKMSEKYVSAVIGKGGAVIRNIEELTNTCIKMEKADLYCSDRVCYIWSDNAENIYSAENMIQSIINNLPVIETFELFVPFEVSRRIFKKNWNDFGFVQEIRKTHGTKIILESDPHKTETGLKRRIILKGTADQIAAAIIQIEDKVQDEIKAEVQLRTQVTTARISELSHINIDIKNTTEDHSDIETYKLLVPHEACGRIIGKNRCTVQEMERFSGSKIILENVANKFENGLMEVYVSAMETPSLFWIQVVGSANIHLQHLVHDMTKYYNEKENCQLHTLKKIIVGQMVAARFKYDNKWYRAEVISVMESSEYKVFFVDYGDLEIVPIDDILELRTDMLSLRLQAVECSLANVKPRESEWSSKANDKFAELTHLAKWKPLIAQVKGYKERSVGYGGSRRENSLIPSINLYDKDNDKNINIGDSLIQLEMAQIEEDIRSAVNLALSRDFPFIPFLPDSLYLD
ncbi:PREDICTED: tudor and KH domain-containing protein-like isoform X2 [Trachymyrmex septentrionalis]|uniref:tudor and KH domain-containing protein-like isoform X2 n=1 Tax=Trachymyrmex septentrionalis TaxID=34720 RepID=UPI00084F1007|nr:PREDICTED: tudor and KH domain-containing protein-like isoform X2 [Trachymyrmex septentrionalis]